MKVGLFFGSFNPIHSGHLMMANYLANHTDLEEVWLVVSPHNPLKDKKQLANMYDRLEMANLALNHAERIRVSDIEFNLPQPSYTIDTLTHLSAKYPQHQFCLIIGGDNLASFKKWKNAEVILRDYSIYVYPRPGFEIPDWAADYPLVITKTPLMEISSTFIRNAIQQGKSVKFFIPDTVFQFIDKKGLYL